jgi:hypothetical protein
MVKAFTIAKCVISFDREMVKRFTIGERSRVIGERSGLFPG